MSETNAFSLISQELTEKLKSMNITTPTKVQDKIIPEILEGKNLVFQSETGTGKTFAYLLPLIEKHILSASENSNEKHVKLLITAPTFELASQIKAACQSVCGIKTALFIGGAPIKRQTETLKEKPEIVIGTPARLVELIRLKKLKTQYIKAAVYDEADRLVKKELIDEIKNLTELLPAGVQKIACTATVDGNTKRFFSESVLEILPQEDILTKNITHWALHAESRDKIETLRKFLNAEKPEKALIFTSRADQVENIYSKLKYKKIPCTALHAKTDRQERKAAIDRFRSGKERILITSDLAARGLDISGITHVIQMDLPQDQDFFIHRAGRTARAGKKGINLLIGDEYELRNFALLEKKLKITVYPKELRDGKLQQPEGN